MHFGNRKIVEIFQRHGFFVVRLCLTECIIDSYCNFAEILQCMPNLKHLSIFATTTLHTVRRNLPKKYLPQLKKLKTLDMVGSQYSIMECLKNAKLRTMKIFNSNFACSNDCTALEEFLKSQNILTTLALRSIDLDSSMMFRTENLNAIPFQLTQLSLLNIRLRQSPNDYANLMNFLELQASTLKELELGQQFPNFVFDFLLAKMTNLKTLSLMMSEIPHEHKLNEQLEENRSIENLIFLNDGSLTKYNYDEHGDLEFLRDFFKRVPNIKKITAPKYFSNEKFQVIAESCIKLETLSTFFFNQRDFRRVKFPHLNSLHIQHLTGVIDWNEFTKANSRLTKLTIEETITPLLLTINDIKKITANIKLHTLRLGENFEVDKRFLDAIRKNCPDLKVFDLHMCSLSSDLKLNFDYTNVIRLYDRSDYAKKHSTLWVENEKRFKYDINIWDTNAIMRELP